MEFVILTPRNLHVHWAPALRSGKETCTESSSAFTLWKCPALLSAQASGHLKYWHNGPRSEWLFTTQARSPFFHLAFSASAFLLRPICALPWSSSECWSGAPANRTPPPLGLIQGPFHIRGQGTYYSSAALFRRTCINSRKEWECYVHNGIWKAFRFFCSHCLSILF